MCIRDRYTAFGIPQGAKNAEAVPYYLRYVLDRNNYDQSHVYESEKMRKDVYKRQVYVYDRECNLLTAFGGGRGFGTQLGLFLSLIHI